MLHPAGHPAVAAPCRGCPGRRRASQRVLDVGTQSAELVLRLNRHAGSRARPRRRFPVCAGRV